LKPDNLGGNLVIAERHRGGIEIADAVRGDYTLAPYLHVGESHDDTPNSSLGSIDDRAANVARRHLRHCSS
jgi:hypothetical protein